MSGSQRGGVGKNTLLRAHTPHNLPPATHRTVLSGGENTVRVYFANNDGQLQPTNSAGPITNDG